MDKAKVKHFGKLGVNVYTLTNSTNAGEAYDAFHDSDLVFEITAILEAKGYIVRDVFLDFNEQEVAKPHDVVNYERAVSKGKKNMEGLYQKVHSLRFAID